MVGLARRSMEPRYQRVGPAARETRPDQSSRCIGRICDATTPNQLYIGDVRRTRLTRHVVVESGVHPSHITAEAAAAAAAAAGLMPLFTNTRVNRIHGVVHRRLTSRDLDAYRVFFYVSGDYVSCEMYSFVTDTTFSLCNAGFF